MNFSIKRDYLPVVLLNILLVLLLVLFICLTFCRDGGWSTGWGFSFFALGTLIALVLYDTSVIFTWCKLDLENHTLTYVAGVFKYSIDIKDIVDVRKSVNIYQSIAPSYNRVRIVTNRNNKQNVYYIAVADNNQLISMLKKEIAANKEAEEEAKRQKERKAEEKVEKKVRKTTRKRRVTKKAKVAKK